jgi:hypothetical protein
MSSGGNTRMQFQHIGITTRSFREAGPAISTLVIFAYKCGWMTFGGAGGGGGGQHHNITRNDNGYWVLTADFAPFSTPSDWGLQGRGGGVRAWGVLHDSEGYNRQQL